MIHCPLNSKLRTMDLPFQQRIIFALKKLPVQKTGQLLIVDHFFQIHSNRNYLLELLLLNIDY